MSYPITKFEALSANPNIISSRGSTGYGSTSGGAELGKRNNASLARGFAGSPILSNTYKIINASEEYQSYTGENVDFPQYRRNFIPDDKAGAEYQNVRDKRNTPIGEGGKPATPYSPNIASPIVTEGAIFTDYNQLTVIETGLDMTQMKRIRFDLTLNPQTYINVDSSNQSNNVGEIRRFKLGVGSTKTQR